MFVWFYVYVYVCVWMCVKIKNVNMVGEKTYFLERKMKKKNVKISLRYDHVNNRNNKNFCAHIEIIENLWEKGFI